jgi:3-hydroxyisobutyrate dehydrogenase/putative dehydrogenase
VLDAARARYEQAAEAGLIARDDSRVIETYTAEG